MEPKKMSLSELTQLYKDYIKLSDKPDYSSREESQGKKGKLEDQINSATNNGTFRRFTDVADFLSTIETGIESGKLGNDLYASIGRDIYDVATNNNISKGNHSEQTLLDKKLDNVFTALSDRLKSAESNTQTATKIHSAYNSIIDMENKSQTQILTEERTEQWAKALSSRTDLPQYFLSTVMTRGNVSTESKLAFISNPEMPASQAIDIVSKYRRDINAKQMPEQFRRVILQKLIDMPTEEHNHHQATPKEVQKHEGLNSFAQTLYGEEIKDLPAEHWIVRWNKDEYNQARSQTIRKNMNQELTGNESGKSAEGRLGKLGKWFDDKTKDARIAATREQRPLTEKEEKDLVMAGAVYMILANHAMFESIKKGKVTSIDPDKYAERIKGLLERDKDSGLAPQKTASGKETMQISFERELNGLIPKKQTFTTEKTTEVKAKGLKGLLGKKDKITAKVSETRALTDEERKEAKSQLDTQFANVTERAFYENLALKVNQLHVDMPKPFDTYYDDEFSKKAKQITDKVNDTQIVKGARPEIKNAIHSVEEDYATQIGTSGYRESVEVRKRETIHSVDRNQYTVIMRKHNKNDQARNVAMEAIRKAKGR